MHNNLFYYATSELSQDAFICYRASSKTGKIGKITREALIWKRVDGQWVDVAGKYHFKKPQRYGTGKSVALGVYDAKVATYRDAVTAIENAIGDFYALVEELRKRSQK